MISTRRGARCIGKPHARVLDGVSTGGWVSLALQIFYPDYFNGAWSHCPDPVDFRAFELINVYANENAYVNSFGFERPARRTPEGDVIYTVRHECQMERVLGRGDRWELSGKDWCAWNATFGPRGDDGLPKPLWHPKTGAIDRSVTEHWKKYDLRMVLQNNWKELAPKLKGKIHIYVGDGDDYFLNNAVRLLDTAARQFNPPFDGEIRFGPAAGHGYHPVADADMFRAMAARDRATSSFSPEMATSDGYRRISMPRPTSSARRSGTMPPRARPAARSSSRGGRIGNLPSPNSRACFGVD